MLLVGKLGYGACLRNAGCGCFVYIPLLPANMSATNVVPPAPLYLVTARYVQLQDMVFSFNASTFVGRRKFESYNFIASVVVL